MDVSVDLTNGIRAFTKSSLLAPLGGIKYVHETISAKPQKQILTHCPASQDKYVHETISAKPQKWFLTY
jgi:hypothetical protein